jgi:ubiquinone biosynthesis protein COQ9
MSEDRVDERRRLMEAILPHVAFDGWTHQALVAGFTDAGREAWEIQRYFPGGPADVLVLFSTEADRKMLEALNRLDLDTLRVRDRVAQGVRLRLEALTEHKEAVRRGLAFFALPGNAPRGLACLHRTVDLIWYAAGDRATDYNYYTKRMLLAGVFSSTLVFWLNDRSEDQAASWAFLDRRIDEVMKVGGRLGKTVGRLLDLPERLAAGLRPKGTMHGR